MNLSSGVILVSCSGWWSLLAVLFWPVPAQVSTIPLQQALALFNSGKYRECFEIVSPFVQQNPNNGDGPQITWYG